MWGGCFLEITKYKWVTSVFGPKYKIVKQVDFKSKLGTENNFSITFVGYFGNHGHQGWDKK